MPANVYECMFLLDTNKVAGDAQTGVDRYLAVAQRAVAPYIGQPSPFPATEPLKRRPVGATLDYVDCGTPTCALMYSFVQPAAKAMGMKLNRILAGSSASGVQNALDSVVAQKPAAMILPWGSSATSWPTGRWTSPMTSSPSWTSCWPPSTPASNSPSPR